MAPGDDGTKQQVVVVGAGYYYGIYTAGPVATTAPHIVTIPPPNASMQTALVTAIADVANTFAELRKIDQEVHEKTHWQQFNKTAFGNKRKKR
jgi:hypothetical protein